MAYLDFIGIILVSIYSSIILLLQTFRGLWLGLLFILMSMILMFSYVFFLQLEVTSEELAGYGLVANVHVKLSGNGISSQQAYDIARNISLKNGALVVPIQTIKNSNCRFYTLTTYSKEVSVVINGFDEIVEKKYSTWVPNGIFSIVLNTIDTSVTPPELTVLSNKRQSLGSFSVIEFAEDAVQLDILASQQMKFNEDDYYYLHHTKVKGVKIGPYSYDEMDNLFYLLAEEDLDLDELHLLNGAKDAFREYTNFIYRYHLPFRDGVAIEQLQLGKYEYSKEQSDFNNQIILTSLLNQNIHDGIQTPRAFMSDALFRKIFPNQYDFKEVKLSCVGEGGDIFEKKISIYGHYKLKTSVTENPNQIFVAEQNSHLVNGFLLKDVGGVDQAIVELEEELEENSVIPSWETNYIGQQLIANTVFTIAIIIIIIAMGSIILSLAMPLRKIMIKELFLIKLFGGDVVLVTITTVLLVFLIALLASFISGAYIMQYINEQVLAPYNVPLMQFNIDLFQLGAACVFFIWLAVWFWLCYDLKAITDKYGLSKGD